MNDREAMERFLLGPTDVVTLPSPRSPRLIATAKGARQRWVRTALYPAFRLNARAARHVLRAAASLGAFRARRAGDDAPELRRFLAGRVPEPDGAVVLMGTPGPAQKLVVQAWRSDRIVAYLKYAEAPIARARLERERQMLERLPGGVGPALLGHGLLFGGSALLLEALPGRRSRARWPAPPPVRELLQRMADVRTAPLQQHPWVRELERTGRAAPVQGWLDRLAGRNWPIVQRHGDLVAWNLVEQPGGRVRAVDWEFGADEGFPHLDEAHYLLQTALLVKRWTPAVATERSVAALRASHPLASSEAEALVRLSAYSAYLEADDDGVPPSDRLQRLRRAVTEASPAGC